MNEQWNWDHLRYFLAMAESGTLATAAGQLNVSHTTVLRRIRSLEQSLQTRLFNHTSSGYQLTDAGGALLKHAQQLQHSIHNLSDQIGGADAALAGSVSITTTDTIAYQLLPDILHQLQLEFPMITLTLDMRTRISNVMDREADIAIRSGKKPPEQLIGRKIGVIRFSACAAESYLHKHQITRFPSDTKPHRFIVLDKAVYGGIPVFDWLESRLSNGVHKTTVNNFLLASAMCRAGLGITVLPSYLVENSSELVQLATNDPVTHNDLWILSHKDLRDNERVRTVRQFLYQKLSLLFAE